MLRSLWKVIYFDGPKYFGGWQGRSKFDICAQLTNLKSSYWMLKKEDCDEILDEHLERTFRVFSSFGTLFFILIVLKDTYGALKMICYEKMCSLLLPRTTIRSKNMSYKINDCGD